MENNYVVETKNLTKIYSKKTVVNGVNMHIKEGEIYGFVGENGSGKTTIMRMLMNLAIPSKGNYALFGIDSKDSNISKVRKHISAIVESPSLVISMTAYENLKYACLYYGIKDFSVIDYALKSVGLSNTGKKKVKNFSLGMRQRLGIAILLLNKPKLLLLDEPMNGLDPEGIKEIREMILDLNKQGITILISSHILSELEKVATTWGFITHGNLVEEISAEELNDKCEKSLDLQSNNVDDLEGAVKKLGYNYKRINNIIKIYDNIKPFDVLKALDKEHIEINEINTSHLSVEDYYLNLVNRGGNN